MHHHFLYFRTRPSADL